MFYILINIFLTPQSVYSFKPAESSFKHTISPCYTHSIVKEHIQALDTNIISNLKKIDILELNDLQKQVIPQILDDSCKNICILSQTGTGKTVSYLVPILQSLLQSTQKQANTLIIVPNSILMYQVHDVLKSLTEGLPIKVKAVDDIETGDLAHIVVSSPLKLLNKFKTYNMNYKTDAFLKVRHLVLDEVDQLLVHKQNIMEILRKTTGRYLFITHAGFRNKTILCSSTLSDAGTKSDSKVLSQLFKDCTYIKSEDLHKIPSKIAIEFIHYIDEQQRFDKLVECLNSRQRTIIYCNTSSSAIALYSKLKKLGKNVHLLNKNVDPIEQIMIATSDDKKVVVISTDLSSRGVDFRDIKLLIHYDFPTNAINFIHRTGRVGRNGKQGSCVAFWSDSDAFLKNKIETNLDSLEKVFSRRRALRKKSKKQLNTQKELTVPY